MISCATHRSQGPLSALTPSHLLLPHSWPARQNMAFWNLSTALAICFSIFSSLGRGRDSGVLSSTIGTLDPEEKRLARALNLHWCAVAEKTIAENRRARHDYQLLERYEAGLV